MTRIVDFADHHVAPAVAIFCDVFGAPPWSEWWSPHEARARFDDLRASPGGRGWAAVDGATLVGFALGRAGGDGVFILEEMAVRRARQCQGIGTRLMRALEDDVERDGFDVVEILTQAGKWPCYFYEKLGYRLTRERAHGVVILSRSLDP